MKLKETTIFFLLGISPLISVNSFSEPTLETTVVTGNPTADTWLTTPLAISQVSNKQLTQNAHEHISDSLNQVAGTWVTHGNGQEHLTAIRSPVFTGAGACGAFLMLQDNIPVRAQGFCNINQLIDTMSEQAETIEILRGPASSTYGSNAVHGVINVLSPNTPQARQSKITLEGGPHNWSRLKYHYGNTEGKHGYLVQLNTTKDDGFQEDSGFSQHKLLAKHQYQSEQISITTQGRFIQHNQETAGFIQGNKGIYKNDNAIKNNPNPEAFRDWKSWHLSSRINYQVNSDYSWSVTPYYRKTDMAFLQHYLPWKAQEDNGHESIGIQLANQYQLTNQLWRWGMDTEYTQGWLKEFQAKPFSPSQPQGLHYDYQVDSTLLAPWLNWQWQPLTNTTIAWQLRYDYLRYNYNNQQTAGSSCAVSVSNCRFYRPKDTVDTFKHWSSSVSLTQQITPSQTLYARFATGQRAPQTTELYRLQNNQANADLDSVALHNIEIGYRGYNQWLEWSTAAFVMQKKHIIVQDTNRQYIGDGRSKHYGVELESTIHLTQTLQLNTNLSFARHKYQGSDWLITSNQALNGNDIDTAPQRLSSLRLNWQITPELSSQLEWQSMGAYYLDPANQHKYPGHNVLHLRTQWQVNPQWQLNLRLQNLLNEEYAQRADFAFGQYRYFVGEPRGVYLSVSSSF